jgi:hypothetical protein
MSAHEYSAAVAVLIPLYRKELSEADIYSINNTLTTVNGRDIYFIAPKKLKQWLTTYANQFKNISVKIALFKDDYFDSVAGYNKLMLSISFYRYFSKYNNILIVQTDALIFSDSLDEWIGKKYSYIGAPWFVGFDNPIKPLRFFGVGNGGFSLRNTSDFIRVLSKFRHVPNIYNSVLCKASNTHLANFKSLFRKYVFAYNMWPLFPRVNEDIFWGMLVPDRFGFFKVPTPNEALYFSFEAEPAYLYELTENKLPMGCHAWEKYDKLFWREVLLNQVFTPR